MHHTSFTSTCNACRAYRPCIAWTRKIAGQCTHRHRTNRKTSAVSVTHRCKRSADREQLGCHDYQTARRSRHRIETCDSPSPSDFRGSRRTLLGSQLTKGGYIGIGNLRCARRTIRCARRTNCSTIASGSCPAIRQCIALARMEGTGQPREAGKTACHFRRFLMSARGARQWKPVPR